ncbi:DUF1236 domain-containing protein [Pseudooceanicola sp.]|uniref:DUF1236 domain-containing protein n=1 Tax=Pseudooceanicola sp. TaxID=1914328 RepID=UPI0040590DF8
MIKRIAIASTIGALTATTALAATDATATTDLNLRAGPGPKAEIISVIPGEAMVSVEQCASNSQWCRVSYDGQQGWAYGAYLNAPVQGAEPMAVYENREQLQIETVEVEDEEAEIGGALAGGTMGGIIALAAAGGPATVAAAIGAGIFTGALSADEEKVVTYVRENPVEPVYVQGEVVRGVTIPQEIQLQAVPESEYQYVYLNGVPAVVNADRQVVTVIR